MNGKLKDPNGWVLCPSKSFPGKFYYFNLRTGETAWSYDADVLQKRNCSGNIYKITNNSHTYPEPLDPPKNYMYPITNNLLSYRPNQLETSFFYQPQNPHSFGQSSFPKYMPNETKVIWSPLKVNIERKPENNNMITSSKQLSVTKNQFEFAKPNPFAFRQQKVNRNISNINMKNSNFNNETFLNSSSKVFLRKPLLNKTREPETKPHWTIQPSKLNQECQTDSNSSTINGYQEVRWDNNLSSEDNSQLSDLRYVLQAKKRTSVNLNQGVETTQPPAKKKVTFNLSNIKETKSSEDIHNGGVSEVFVESKKPTKYDIEDIAAMAAPNTNTDVWYVLPDVEVLTEHFDFLLNLVGVAKNCRLQIPRCVYESLFAAARDLENPKVGKVRTVLRKLKNMDVEVQEAESELIVQKLSLMDRLLNFCMYVMTRRYHVVILTEDQNTYKRAKSLSLHCFKIEEISLKSLTREKEAYQNLQIVKNTIEKDKQKESAQRNLFLPSPDKIPLFSLKTEENDVTNIQTRQITPNNIYLKYLNNNKERNNNFLTNSLIAQMSERSDSLSSDKDSNSYGIRKDLKKIHLNNANVDPKFNNTNNTLMHLNKSLTGELLDYNSPESKSNNTSSEDSNLNELKFSKWPNSNAESKMTSSYNIGTSSYNQPVSKESEMIISNLTVSKEGHMTNSSNLDMSNSNQLETKIFSNDARDGMKSQFNNGLSNSDLVLPKQSEFSNVAKFSVPNDVNQIADSFNIDVSNTRLPISRRPEFSNFSLRPGSNEIGQMTNKFGMNTLNSDQQESKNQELSFLYKAPVSNEAKVKPKTTKGSDIEDSLKIFRVDSKVVEERVRSRIEEWICCLTQIMEDVLSEVLQEESKSYTPVLPAPWTFQEAIKCLSKLPGDEQVAKIGGVLAVMLKKNEHSGKIKTSIKPNIFIQILGCSHLLLQALKISKPHIISIPEAINSLIELLHLLKNISKDPDQTLFVEKVSPLMSSDGEDGGRRNLPNKSSDVLEYVKKHYPLQLETDPPTNVSQTDQVDAKCSTTPEEDLLAVYKKKINGIDRIPTKSMKNLNNVVESLRFIKKNNLIHAFENKLQIKEKTDLDALDYEIDSNASNEIERKTEIKAGELALSEVTDDSEDNVSSTIRTLKLFLLGLSYELKEMFEFNVDSILLLNKNYDLDKEIEVRKQSNIKLKNLRNTMNVLKRILSREQVRSTSLVCAFKDTLPKQVAKRQANIYRSIIEKIFKISLTLETCLQSLCNHPKLNKSLN